MSERPDAKPNSLVDVLLQELESCRSDDRDSMAQIIQTIVVVVAAVAIVFSVAVEQTENRGMMLLCFALTLALFSAAFLLILSKGMVSSLRYHYMVELERRLAEELGPDVEYLGWSQVSSPIVTLNIGHIETKYTAMHFASIVLAVVAAGATCLMFVSAFYFMSNGVPSSWLFLVTVAALPPVIVFFVYSSYKGTSTTSEMYELSKKKALRKYQEADQSAEQDDSSRKKISSRLPGLLLYLLYPRPQDLMKVLFVVAGALVGMQISSLAGSASSSMTPLDWVILLAVVDLLGYQARYQWNDIRGYVEDSRNPKHKDRGRLAVFRDEMGSAPIAASAGVLVYRLLLAVAIILCVSDIRAVVLAVALAAIFVLALLYEALRKREAPSPVILLVVSLGYPLRMSAGFFFAYPQLLEHAFPALVISAALVVLATMLFGIVFVGTTWALEGWAHFVVKGPSDLYGKRHVRWLADMVRKTHGLEDAPEVDEEGEPIDPTLRFPLTKRDSLAHPWNAAMLGSGLLLIAAAWTVAPDRWFVSALCVVGLVLLAFVIAFPGRTKAGSVFGGALTVLSLVAMAFSGFGTEAGLASFEMLIFSAYVLVFAAFRSMSYAMMAKAVKEFADKAKGACEAFLVWFVGKPQADLLAKSRNGGKREEPDSNEAEPAVEEPLASPNHP